MPPQKIFTIGHGGRTIESFLDLLRQHEIAYLIDVRSRPYSRYQPDFTKQALEYHLQGQNIRYVFMGDQLGGRPGDPECYTDGKVDYELLRVQDFYRAGLERLERAWRQDLSLALLCSERKPEQCHRSKLIGRSLLERDIGLVHIDENDDILTQEEVMLRIIGSQPSLFGEDFHQLTSRKRYWSEEESSEDEMSTGEAENDT